MGKTVESYRRALDKELREWSGFAKALRKEHREVFEKMMNACRNYASAGSSATRPILFEPMVVSILLHHQRALNRIEKELDATREQQIQP
jgi:hypothetical protein